MVVLGDCGRVRRGKGDEEGKGERRGWRGKGEGRDKGEAEKGCAT